MNADYSAKIGKLSPCFARRMATSLRPSFLSGATKIQRAGWIKHAVDSRFGLVAVFSCVCAKNRRKLLEVMRVSRSYGAFPLAVRKSEGIGKICGETLNNSINTDFSNNFLNRLNRIC
jgi:hypothetical protein